MAEPTEQEQPTVHGQMLRGSIWTIGLRWSLRLTGLVSTVLLARLLTPEDFGVVAIAMLVVGAVEVLSETGQRLALIRHPDPSRRHYDSAWTISVLIGLGLGLVLFAVAPWTTLYFREPRAVPVIECLALRAMLGGFENIGVAKLRRDLKFDILFRIAVYQKLISFAVTVTLALLLRNYWALVAGIVTSQLAGVALSYAMQEFRPRFSLAEVRELWSFSIWALFKHIGNYLHGRVDEFAIGGFAGAGAMGRYNVAADVASMPSNELNEPIVATLFPVMSTVQHDGAKLRQLYLGVLSWSALICVSTSIGVALVADDLVDLVLGAQWQDVKALMPFLALAAGLLGLTGSVYTALEVTGRPDIAARLQWVRLGLLALAVLPVAFLWRNLELIAATRLVVTAALTPALFVALGRSLQIPLVAIFATLWRPLVAGAVMATLVVVVDAGIASAGVVRLFLDAALGGASFIAAVLMLWLVSGRPDTAERDLLDRVRSVALGSVTSAKAASRSPSQHRPG